MAKIGLLPLYIALYDETSPELRVRLEAFYESAAKKLEACGLEVLRAPFCRVKPEFESAVGSFEKNGAKCVVTLHMAYSPSLESSQTLAKTKLPLVVLDATETFDFGPFQDPGEILYCHGIHGVMDMCSLLNQNGKKFAIAAGHIDRSGVISRVAGFARAAASAGSLCSMKVGSVGGPFAGMGDFAVTESEMLGKFGVEIVNSTPETFMKFGETVTEREIEEEMAADENMFERIGEFSRESHRRTIFDSLSVRKWIEANGLSAFSVNFMKIGAETGLWAMPFLEACKAMARGIGYAGEGDVLTASFAGALLSGFPDSSFVEIFCPDWNGNALFLSHMGEMNINLAAHKPEIFEKNFIYGAKGSVNPVSCSGCYRGGEGIFANIFKAPGGFRLLVSPVTMESEPESAKNYAGHIRGWMKPRNPVGEFLENLSRAGATHHSILVYGAQLEQMKFFGELAGLETVEI
ncbi:MAG: hypothetical protein FWG34_08050 [Oscillospiraceae bacterium]|nr:hypothetical protein [Oscillospiraceae bacterium]